MKKIINLSIVFVLLLMYFQQSFSSSLESKVAFDINKFSNYLGKNKIKEAKDHLFECVKANDFDAQILLARIYLGNQKLSRDINSFSVNNYCDVEKYTDYAKNLNIEQNISECINILNSAAGANNPEAKLMLALMYFDGIGLDKDRSKASELLSSLESTYPPARFYMTYHFVEPSLLRLDCSKIVENIIPSEDSPYTFIPEKSLEWNYLQEERRELTNDSVKYIETTPPRNLAGKRLVPIQLIREMYGWISDTGIPIYLADPGQRNRFSYDGKIFVDKNKTWICPDEGGFFLFSYLSETKNGVQIVNILDNGGGSLTSKTLDFYAFENLGTINDDGITEITGIRKLGSLTMDSKGGYRKLCVSGNVIGIYEIITNADWSNEDFKAKITLISFEKDEIKRRDSEYKLVSKLLEHCDTSSFSSYRK